MRRSTRGHPCARGADHRHRRPGRLLPGRAAGGQGLRRHRGGPGSGRSRDRRTSRRVRDRVALVGGDLLDPATLTDALGAVRPARALPPGRADVRADLVGGPGIDPRRDRRRDRDAARRPPGAWIRRCASSSRRRSEVFGDAGESPQHERSPMRPRSPYGVAKLAAHGLVGALREHFGMYAVLGITYNHESPRRPAALPAAQGDAGRRGDRAGAGGRAGARRPGRGARLVARGRHRARRVAVAAGRGAGRLRLRLGRRAGRWATSSTRRSRRPALAPEGRMRVDPAFVRAAGATPPVGDPSRARARAGLGAGDLLRGS